MINIVRYGAVRYDRVGFGMALVLVKQLEVNKK